MISLWRGDDVVDTSVVTASNNSDTSTNALLSRYSTMILKKARFAAGFD